MRAQAAAHGGPRRRTLRRGRPARAARGALRGHARVRARARRPSARSRASLDAFRRVSPERVRDEWLSTLAAKQPSRGFEVMRATGILARDLPRARRAGRLHAEPVPRLRRLEALARVHGRLPTRAGAPARGAPARPRQAAHARAVREDPGLHLLQPRDRRRAAWPTSGCARYRFSNDERERVVHLVRNHLVCYSDEWTDAAVRRFVRRVGRCAHRRPARPRARRRARQGARRDRGAGGAASGWPRASSRWRTQGVAFGTRDLAIDGNDVMKRLGIPPGPLGRQGARRAATTRARAARAERARGAARGRRIAGRSSPIRCGDRETSSTSSPTEHAFRRPALPLHPGHRRRRAHVEEGRRAVPGAARDRLRHGGRHAAHPHRDVRQPTPTTSSSASRASRQAARGSRGMPELVLGAEHFCDDRFWGLFERGRTLPYTGGKALLLELPPERMPLGLDERCFRMQVRGVRPVLAHPERYAPLFARPRADRAAGRAGRARAARSDVARRQVRPQAAAHRRAHARRGRVLRRLQRLPPPGRRRARERRDRAAATSWWAATRRTQLLAAHPRAILRGEVER